MNDKIERISSNLQGTTRNLRSLDHMLGEYKEIGKEQKTAIDKLRSDLSKTCDSLKQERRRSIDMSPSRGLHASDLDLSTDREQTGLKSALRGYDSDVESPTSRGRKRRSGSVRFADDMNRELHSLHQNVRDVSCDHNKLEDSFSHEIPRRDVNDADLRRSVRDVADNVRLISTNEPVNSSVERRLQSIQNEIKAERQLMDRRYDEVGSISSHLKDALQYHQHLLHQPPPQPPPQPTQTLDDIKFQKHYLETEALKYKVETELDHIKRQLDHSEGGKVALMNQIDELKSRLTKADHDKQRLKSQLEESHSDDTSREKRRKREMEDEREREHSRFANEIQDLKTQLTKSMSAVGVSEELRREVERSERQRTQLSDHIEVLTKDLENKEKQYAKVIGQLKETSDKHEDSERQKHQMFIQLEDALTRLKDIGVESERLAGELRMTQHNLQASDRKREEFKNRAQETVKQWKAKCKQLQVDCDQYKQGYNENKRRNDQLMKDVDMSREQNASVTMAMEKVRGELSESLVANASLDEMSHQKDKEINDLRSVKIEIESEIRDARISNNRLHHELENAKIHLSAGNKERSQLEEQLNRIQSAHLVSQDHNTQLQRDMKEMKRANKDIGGQLADARNHMEEMKLNIQNGAAREKSLDGELGSIKNQLREAQSTQAVRVEELNAQLLSLKAHHEWELEELGKQVKREIREYEGEIDMLRVELEKERVLTKRTRQTDEKLHKELHRLHEEVQRYEEDKLQSMRKIEKLQLDCENQTQKSLDDLETLKTTENELFHLKEQQRGLEEENKTIVERISSDVDGVIEVINEESKTKYQELGRLPVDTPYLLNVVSSIRNRLQWLKREIRDQRKEEKRLRQDLMNTTNMSEKDRNYLMSEIEKKEERLDELTIIKDELLQRDDQNVDAVVMLNEKLKDISDQLHIQKLREDGRIKELIVVENKDSDVVKINIEERYSRLKETMRQLQEDLRDTKLTQYLKSGAGDACDNSARPTSHSKSIPKDHDKSPHRHKNRKSPVNPTTKRLLDDRSNKKFPDKSISDDS